MQRNPNQSYIFALGLGCVLFCASIITIVLWNEKKSHELAYELTAQAYSTSLSTFREFYSSIILDRLHGSNVTVTHDYHARDNALPIPATMTLDLAQYLNGRNANVNLRLVSEYPFPWRAKRDLSEFEVRALNYLNEQLDPKYSELKESNADTRFQYAVPIRMKKGCVACHNSHPASPKRDWKIGDVRGLQIVSLDPRQLHVENDLKGPYYVVVATLLFFTFSVSVIFWLLSKNNLSLRLLERATGMHRKARLAAEESSLVKSRFLAVVSHEMRTPINAINGMLREISYGTTDPRVLEMAGVALSSSDLLGYLIEDVIDVTRLENDKFAFNRTSFDVGIVADEVVSLLSDRAKAKELSLNLDTKELAHPLIECDRSRLKQVLINLVGNAIKFTESGSINVVCRSTATDAEHAQITFEVHDTGKGIDEDDLKNIFERFYQTNIGDGLGLGLAISKDIVDRLGGTVTVESQKGLGSTFTISIPVKLAQQPDLEANDRVAGKPLDGIHLLVAEDNSTNQYVIKLIIDRLGGTLAFADNGQAAVEMAQSAQYDLILMDINMPVMDGVTAFIALKDQTQGDHPPVIALTANALPEQLEAYLREGMAGCVTKPIQEVELIRTILSVLGRPDSIGIVELPKPRNVPTLNARQKSAVDSLLASMDEN